MSDKMLTWEDIERGVYGDDHIGGVLMPIEVATIRSLAQALADSPCPVCSGHRSGIHGWHFEEDMAGNYVLHRGECPHCGDYPPDRRGLYARDPGHALEMVAKLRKGGFE